MRTPLGHPGVQCALCWRAVGNHPLFRSLAQHSSGAPGGVDIIDIEPDEFTDAHARRVEHLQDESVSDMERITIIGGDHGHIHEGRRLALLEDTRKCPMRTGSGEARARISREKSTTMGPGCEDARRGGPARQRRTRVTVLSFMGQPTTKIGEVEVAEGIGALGTGVGQEPGHIAEVGADRVRASAKLDT